MTARNTLNSQSAAYDALSLAPDSEGTSSQPAVSSPPSSSLAPAASLESPVEVSPTSPSFLAAVAHAVQQVLSAQQTASLPVPSSSTSVAMSGGVPAPQTPASQLAKASSFAASGAGFTASPSATATPVASVGQIPLLSRLLCRRFQPQFRRSPSRRLLPRSMQPFLRALRVLLLWCRCRFCINRSWWARGFLPYRLS